MCKAGGVCKVSALAFSLVHYCTIDLQIWKVGPTDYKHSDVPSQNKVKGIGNSHGSQNREENALALGIVKIQAKGGNSVYGLKWQ